MVSLLKLAKVTEEGVRFLSPHDGTPMYVARDAPLLLLLRCHLHLKFTQASNAGTLDLLTKFDRFRYHYAVG